MAARPRYGRVFDSLAVIVQHRGGELYRLPKRHQRRRRRLEHDATRRLHHRDDRGRRRAAGARRDRGRAVRDRRHQPLAADRRHGRMAARPRYRCTAEHCVVLIEDFGR